MDSAVVDGRRIAYSSLPDGVRDRPAVLLIHGLGRQLSDWDTAFTARITASGYRVVAIDNRDSGLSSRYASGRKLALGELRRAIDRGNDVDVPYRLVDMADDAALLLDYLDIEAAHVVGVSMGGYIAQELAINHPDRVLTLTSIMSSTGSRTVGQPDAAGRRALFRAPPADMDAAVEDALEAGRLLATPGEFDEVVERARVREALERAFDPAGTGRQLAAIWASPDRTESLGRLSVPCLVIHGSADALVTESGGRATAAAVPGAKLVVIDGMGHDLPPSRWPIIVREMIQHFDSVTSPAHDPRVLPAQPQQAASLAKIASRAFDDDRIRYGSGPPGFDTPDRHRTIIESGVHCHTIWANGRLAGAAYVSAGACSGEWHLDSIFVDPAAQRHRLGSTLMRFVERAHPAPHCLTLETPYRNTHLHDFYESFGYRWVGSTEPGSHPAATDPQFHLRRYRRDVADPIRGRTDEEILDLVRSLRDDLRLRLDRGTHPEVEDIIGWLDQYETAVAESRREDPLPMTGFILGGEEGTPAMGDMKGLGLRLEVVQNEIHRRQLR